jgi:hypothetical protein
VRTAAAVAAIILTLPLAAAAQPADSASSAAPPAAQGPMTVERIDSGFLIAPDFKVTTVDHTTSELAGVYGGWLTDNTFLVGAGGYWLTNGTSDRQMGYGGVVLQWLAHANDPIGFSAKTLIGGGQATLSTPVSQYFAAGDPRATAFGPNARIRYREGFFVAEPEVDLLVRFSRHVRLTVGAGYRLIGDDGGDVNRLHGATGSVGLQVGGGS